MIKSFVFLISCVTCLFFGCASQTESSQFIPSPSKTVIQNNWVLGIDQDYDGKLISSLEYDISRWTKARVPGTVLGSLVEAGEYPDIYVGKNLEEVETEQFTKPWWYVTEFDAENVEESVSRLAFDGINYRAEVWLNGELVSDKLVGCYTTFDFDISNLIQAKNKLAIKITPPKPGDFTIGFVDWAPTPPDKNMGVWRTVSLIQTGLLAIKTPFVSTKVNKESLDEAWVQLELDLMNYSEEPQSTIVNCEFQGQRISKKVEVDGGASQKVIITSRDFDAFLVKNPDLWWPNNLGKPTLQNLKVDVQVNGQVSDQTTVEFGIREVEDYINSEGHRGYKVNGKEIVIKGAGWVDDLFLLNDSANNETQVQYAKDMNLNTIRFEGFWGTSDHIYSMCDKHGLLAMCGFSCQWEWSAYLGKEMDEADEAFAGMTEPDEMALVADYLHDQVIWLRNHPSIFVWVAGSDRLHHPDLERMHLKNLAEIDPTRPYLGSAKSMLSTVSGPSAVKMDGPYDYVPPIYWYTDTARGGAFGFNTETGPGPQPVVLESALKMIPKDQLWPLNNDTWNYHCGRHEFGTMKRYLKAFDNRYGEATSIEDFSSRAQIANYEAIRPMFEAFSVNKPNATGVVQWMLNSAWPETYWQLYDYYLQPTGAYYGTKKACEPLHLAYDYGDQSIKLINDFYEAKNELSAEISWYAWDSKPIKQRRVSVNVASNSSSLVMKLQEGPNTPNVSFLDLKLKDKNGAIVSSNFYWLSKKQDVMDSDYENSSWIYTPQTDFASFKELSKIPKADISVRVTKKTKSQTEVVIKNTDNVIAFFCELRIVNSSSNESIIPAFFSDNYVSLLAGEEKTIIISTPNNGLLDSEMDVLVSGQNVNVKRD